MIPEPGPTPQLKPVHMAFLIRKDGAVSPLCANTPRKLDLTRESWTNREEAVTCPDCSATLKAWDGQC